MIYANIDIGIQQTYASLSKVNIYFVEIFANDLMFFLRCWFKILLGHLRLLSSCHFSNITLPYNLTFVVDCLLSC